MFADGRSREAAVLQAYRNSQEMRTATDTTLRAFQNDSTQWLRLQELLGQSGCGVDADGLWQFRIRTRGQLHHYFISSSLKHGTPFSKEHFESAARVAMILATQCIVARIITINGGSKESSSQ
jgi:hypothetical protein